MSAPAHTPAGAPVQARAELPENPGIRRILVLKWSALGDVVLASAALEDIHRAFPEAAIDLHTLPAWAELFAHDPRIGRLLTFDVRGRWRDLAAWVWAVRAARYDLIIDLQSSDRSRLLLAALRLFGRAPRYRLGNERRFPYNLGPPPPPPRTHALARLHATLRAGGIPVGADAPVLHPSARDLARVEALACEHGLEAGSYAVFLPGSQAAGYLKRWGARRYAALAHQLRELGLRRVVILGAADEAEECRYIAEACGGFALDLCGRTRILELVPLCRGARFVVANDTGPAHVAAAARRPLVVVCGPTDPRRVRPAGARVIALQAPIYCASCYRKHCTHHSCMQLVSPEGVVAALRTLSALPARAGAA